MFERPDPAARIWRYIDFAKLVDFFDQRALFFARADQMFDPWEGSASPFIETAQLKEITARLKLGGRSPSRDDLRSHWQGLRSRMFLSCWHLAEQESAAMWGLYAGREGRGVALQTTFKRLEQALPSEWKMSIHAGKVRYIDYQRESFPGGNAFTRYLHKRRSFEHEQELRAIFATNQPSPEPGFNVPVDFSTLVENIYISPIAPTWFADLVERTTRHYGSSAPTIHSDLLVDPVK
jgi:hypothetical protein